MVGLQSHVRPQVSGPASWRGQDCQAQVCCPTRAGRHEASPSRLQHLKSCPWSPRGPGCPRSQKRHALPWALGQDSHSLPLHLPGIFHCSCLAPRHPSPGKIPGSLLLPFPNHTSIPPPAQRPSPQSGPPHTNSWRNQAPSPLNRPGEGGSPSVFGGRGERTLEGMVPCGAGVGGVALLTSPYKAGRAARLLDWLIQMSIPPGNRVSIGS